MDAVAADEDDDDVVVVIQVIRLNEQAYAHTDFVVCGIELGAFASVHGNFVRALHKC